MTTKVRCEGCDGDGCHSWAPTEGCIICQGAGWITQPSGWSLDLRSALWLAAAVAGAGLLVWWW